MPELLARLVLDRDAARPRWPARVRAGRTRRSRRRAGSAVCSTARTARRSWWRAHTTAIALATTASSSTPTPRMPIAFMYRPPPRPFRPPAAPPSASADCASLRLRSGSCARPTATSGGASTTGGGNPRRTGAATSPRMNCLTTRSSSEWKLITASRPPGFSRQARPAMPRSSESSSPLTRIRSAWKLRVAGCLPGSRRPTCARPAPASCGCVRIGVPRDPRRSRARCAGSCAPRRIATARRRCRAPRHAPGNRPRSRPARGSMRMSSGASAMKLKPRAASSSCGEDTPRSSSTPSRPARSRPIRPGRRNWRAGSRRVSPQRIRAAHARSPAGHDPSATGGRRHPGVRQHARA